MHREIEGSLALENVRSPVGAARRRRGRPSETYPEERRAMRFEARPALDQAAWTAARSTSADIFEDAGSAAHLRGATQQNRVHAWGRFLTFLDLEGALDREVPPETRPTRERIGAWIRLMRPMQCASTTQRMLL
jgi:hypothetical protein